MSRFGKESGPRRKSELGASKRTRLSLIAVLAGLTMMIVAFVTISAGAASAATDVTPIAPTTTTPSCSNPVKTVTPPNQAGVIWLVNGTPTGATNLNPGDSVAYTAEADQGYQLAAGAQSSFVFANTFDPSTCGTTPPPPPPAKDVCSNIPGNQSVVPSGYVKAGTRCVKQHIDQPLPVTGSHHQKPTSLPETGWTADASQNNQSSHRLEALALLAGGLLLFGTGGTRLCVAAARRRKGGER